jgi:hypothetical protein
VYLFHGQLFSVASRQITCGRFAAAPVGHAPCTLRVFVPS